MIKKLLYSIIFILVIFLSVDKVYAYTYDTNISGLNPYYDITSLSISNNKLTIKGWAYVDEKDNGKFNNNSIEFSPQYTVFIKDNNDNTITSGSYYKNDNSIPTNPFSLTCILFTDNDGTGGSANSGQDCMNYNTSKNYNARNTMIEKNVNQTPYKNRYYDGIDFKITMDISSLQHSTEYHLELQMKLGDYYSNSVPLLIYQDRIHNNSEATKIETKNVTDWIKITSNLALMQNGNIKYNNSASIQSYCHFVHNGNYQYSRIKEELEISTNDVKYYYYELMMSKGAYHGDCSTITNSLLYKTSPSDYKVYAHAGWLQPTGNTGLIIEKRNPCIEGTETETAVEYAINNPGVCCYKIPETCCGNKVYIEELYNLNPNHFLFSSNYCCNTDGIYQINSYDLYKGKNFYSFYHYFNNELESYKMPYWQSIDNTKFYSHNYISNICDKSEWAGKICPSGTTKDEDSTILSMQYVNHNSTSRTIKHDVYMYLENDKVTKDEIGINYFIDADFEDYLRENKSSEFKNINYKDYALNNKHFKITINSVSKVNNTKTNGKYKYKISFSIDITSLSESKYSAKGYYFLPVKLWYCEKEIEEETPPSCSDNTYFNEHKYECCLENPTKEGCACETTSDEVCYTYLETSDCNKESNATYNYGTKTNTLTNGTETITEEIKFNNYPTLTKMKNKTLKAGTGFEYDIDVTHDITMERHYSSAYSGSTTIYCYYSGCSSAKKQSVDNFYSGVDRVLTTDISEIQNLQYNFDGISSEEIYDISMTNGGNRTNLKNDSIRFCESVYNSYTDSWDTTCSSYYSYPSKVLYRYNYKLNLKEKYILKLHNATEESQNILNRKPSNEELKNYLEGGKKFYTSLRSSKGIYGINISLVNTNNKGLTGLLNETEKFTCQYEIVSGIKNTKTTDSDFYFRQISLTTPFPNNRIIGSNWNKYCSDGENCTYITYNEDNTQKGSNVYSNEPLYEITLTPSIIKQVKDYSKDMDNDYSWKNMTTYANNDYALTSNFFNTTGEQHVNWGTNLKFKTNFDRKIKIGDF